ncbi:MAG: hypothetical protein ACXU99_06695, partial [Thermodesulfobacteriota bacterium]
MSTNEPNSKLEMRICFVHLELEFGANLGFACLPVGREFVIWDFQHDALCAIRKTLGSYYAS